MWYKPRCPVRPRPVGSPGRRRLDTAPKGRPTRARSVQDRALAQRVPDTRHGSASRLAQSHATGARPAQDPRDAVPAQVRHSGPGTARGLAQACACGLAQRSWRSEGLPARPRTGPAGWHKPVPAVWHSAPGTGWHSRRPWLSSANALRMPSGLWHKDLWHSVPDRGWHSGAVRRHKRTHRPAQHRDRSRCPARRIWHNGSPAQGDRGVGLAAGTAVPADEPIGAEGVGISRRSVRVAGSVTRRAVRRPLGERRSPIDVRERHWEHPGGQAPPMAAWSSSGWCPRLSPAMTDLERLMRPGLAVR